MRNRHKPVTLPEDAVNIIIVIGLMGLAMMIVVGSMILAFNGKTTPQEYVFLVGGISTGLVGFLQRESKRQSAELIEESTHENVRQGSGQQSGDPPGLRAQGDRGGEG
jgi:hypothetical protein